MKKYIGIIILTLTTISTNLFSQTNEESYGNEVCGTEITPQQLEYLEKTRRDRQNFHFDINNKTTIFVPIQNHVVRRSNGTGGLTTVQLNNIMLTMNHYYGEVNIEFYECNNVNYIDDDQYFDFSSSDENTLAAANDVTNVINIYFFNSAKSGSTSVCGYSRFPPSADRVIMVNSCALNGSTIVHELGHYFSLYHTHGKTNTGTTNELVNGSNCAIAGDDVCDTPADPNLSGRVSSTCGYTGTNLDANNQAYLPQTDNIMSYSRKACRRMFTDGQFSRVVYSIQNDRNYLICNPPAPTANFLSNTTTSCQGAIAFKDISSSLPSSWSWDFGDGGTSTSRNPVHEYQQSGTYTVKLVTTNSNGTDTENKTNFIQINLPNEPLAATPDTICANQSTKINANGSGTLNWYSTLNATTPLATGDTFTTPPLTVNTTYYVNDQISNSLLTAGPTNNTFGTGANYNSNRHLEFNALKPFTLLSVDVYASGAKNRTIELRNFLGLILQDTTVMVNSGKQTIILNFDVPAEQNLQLGVSVTSEIDLYRNSASVSYPYSIPNVLDITGSNGGSANYYFFYNWKVKEADCISPRVAVTVPVKDCTVGIKTTNQDGFKIYPNPSNGIFNLALNGQKIKSIELYTLLGKHIPNENYGFTQSTLDLTNQAKGLYFVKVYLTNEVITKKLVLR